jgi:nucleotide-binding universal stress UspA family protein
MNDLDAHPVVFAYDGSGPARAAIAHAGRTLRFTRGVVVNVWSPVEPAVPAATIAAPGAVALAGGRGLDARERERAEKVAEEGAELARRAGFEADTLVLRRDGPPWRAIVKCAADLDAAMIVTGTRGRSRPVTTVLGSTAEGILRHAHRSVLVVRDE